MFCCMSPRNEWLWVNVALLHGFNIKTWLIHSLCPAQTANIKFSSELRLHLWGINYAHSQSNYICVVNVFTMHPWTPAVWTQLIVFDVLWVQLQLYFVLDHNHLPFDHQKPNVFNARGGLVLQPADQRLWNLVTGGLPLWSPTNYDQLCMYVEGSLI